MKLKWIALSAVEDLTEVRRMIFINHRLQGRCDHCRGYYNKNKQKPLP